MTTGIPSDPEAVIAWTARAYVAGLIQRRRMEETIGFCLRCQHEGAQVAWPFGVPLPYRIQEAEAEQRRVLNPVRRSRHALLAALRSVV